MTDPPPYHPLTSITSTRLLTLLPGIYGTPIQATLREVELTDKPAFEALSYTWGAVTNEHVINVEGCSITIRQNLFNALQRLRYEQTSRSIWVDALSISQTDMNEKGKQVQIIGEIFTTASCVLVWLGEHADDSQRLFDDSTTRSEYTLGCSSINYVPELWVQLLLRPYWCRTWIVQELVLAKSIYVLCGPNLATWDDLISRPLSKRSEEYQSPDELEEHQTLLDTNEEYRFVKASSRVSTINNSRKAYQRDGDGFYLKRLTIIELMEYFGQTKCEDPRDKVYALLSVDKAQSSQRIQTDYTIDTNELFLRVCMARWTGIIAGRHWFPHLYINMKLDGYVVAAKLLDKLNEAKIDTAETQALHGVASMLSDDGYVPQDFFTRLSTAEGRAQLLQDLNPQGLPDWQIRTMDGTQDTFPGLSRDTEQPVDFGSPKSSGDSVSTHSDVLYVPSPPGQYYPPGGPGLEANYFFHTITRRQSL